MRIEETIDVAAARTPEAVALRCGNRSWTYGALRAERDRRAGILIAAGLRVGERVVTAERVTDDYVITILACGRAGLVVAGLSSLLTATELVELTARIAPCLALTHSGAAHPGLSAPRTLPLALPGTPSAAAVAAGAARSAAGSADDPALIRATSSTTGARPKLVLRPHRTATWICDVDLAPIVPTTVCCCTAATLFRPLEVCKTFAAGATLTFPESIGAVGLEAELAAQGVTVLFTTPAILTALARQSAPPPPGLRLAQIGTIGSALPGAIKAAIEARYRATVFDEYGLSECTSITTTLGIVAPVGSIGLPNPGVTVRVVDEADQPLPPLTVGELVVRSPGMMLGYLDEPAATAAVLRDGWFRTGDRAWQGTDGQFHLAGRRGLLINVGGAKVAPEEVEAVLLTHPGVREAVVLALADPLRGEVVRAVIVPEGTPPAIQELRRFCRARLAGYKVPRLIEFRTALPRSALGKVLRHEL